MLTTITTQSGATYQFDGMFCYHRGRNMGIVWALKRIPDDDIAYEVDSFDDLIERMTNCDPGDIQVGDRFYVSCQGYWRLSSRVVEVGEE